MEAADVLVINTRFDSFLMLNALKKSCFDCWMSEKKALKSVVSHYRKLETSFDLTLGELCLL
jgi:hypothetical protein